MGGQTRQAKQLRLFWSSFKEHKDGTVWNWVGGASVPCVQYGWRHCHENWCRFRISDDYRQHDTWWGLTLKPIGQGGQLLLLLDLLLFGRNGQAILIALPLFCCCKMKKSICAAQQQAKSVITRCILRPENAPTCIYGWGSAPDPAAGCLQRSPDPIDGI